MDVFLISVFLSLVLLFIGTNIFWLWNYNKLLNKFMSRNYHEFVQTEVFKTEATAEASKVKEEDGIDHYSLQRARELNGILGMSS